MESDEERKKGKSGKGFAGLSSMVSDVDDAVARAEKTKTEPADDRATAPCPEPHQQAAQQSSGGSPAGKVLLVVGVVMGLIWLLSQSGNKSTPPSRETQSETARPQFDGIVLAVQRRLNELGYDAGVADGLAGPKTRAAIKAFQRDQNLAVDGSASAALLRQANSLESGSLQSSPILSQESPLRPTQPYSSPLAWAGVKKPSMPSMLRAGNSSPDTVFSFVEKSVYVLISAPSEHSLRTKSNISQGSAVAVTPRIALTNCHVLEGNKLHFLVKNDVALAVKIAYGHKDSDRCAVAIESDSLAPIAGVRPHSTLTIGERVYTVGSPKGLENTLGEGIVSGLRREAGIDLVQMSAPISSGSSGGGLFDAAGNLIGITTFLLRDSQNLNFAIAADTFWK